MSAERGTLEVVSEHLALAVQPLGDAVADVPSFRAFLLRLGWQAQSLPAQWQQLADDVDAVATALEAVAADPSLEQIDALLNALQRLHASVDAIDEAPAGVDPALFLADIGKGLFDLLLADYLATALPTAYSMLGALGVLELRDHEETDGRPGFVESHFRWEEIPRLVSEPQLIPARVYGWGTPELDFGAIADDLHELLVSAGLIASLEAVPWQLRSAFGEPEAERPRLHRMLKVLLLALTVGDTRIELGLALRAYPAVDGHPPGLLLQPLVPSEIGAEQQLTKSVTLRVRAGSDIAARFGVLVRPDGVDLRYPFEPGTPPPSAGLGVDLDYAPAPPRLLLGTPAATRLELGGALAGLALDSRAGDFELKLRAALRDLVLTVTAGEQDGFLAQLLGGRDVRVPLPLEISWSSRTGFNFGEGPRLEIAVAPQLQLGPVRVSRLRLAIGAESEPPASPVLDIAAGIGLGARLGPVAVAVDDVGLGLEVQLAPGNAGPVGIEVGARPPRGAGLSIDAAAVTGGGFLSFDPERGQYVGALHLEFGKLTLNAIGLLTTRMPDGSRGFSLLVIIQASGFTPVQLGFGFTLNGVGGLLGVNRTVAVDVLRAGVRNKTLDAILFSQDDPTPRAPQIVSTLQTVFPPAPNQYVFGPMALIGWGTPTLITIEVALILELPAPLRLIVLGRVRATLPEPEHAIVSVNLDVVGVIDFDRSELSVDASLYDSKVGPFALTGDMAARASWGAQPDFAMALGGFHPAFKPPPGFPELRRLALALSTGNNPRLRMEAYLALTSNTVQVGARLELYVEAAGFSLEGNLGFDTLIQFSPFRLLAEIYAHMALKRGGSTLLGLDIHVHLTGPAPWVVWGEASFKILFVSISIPFRATFGRAEDVPAIERQEVWAKLKGELEAAASWAAQLPPESGRLVVLRGEAGDSEVLAHPLGTLTVSQRVLPLERTLGLFGAAPPKDYDRFEIVAAGGLGLAGKTSDYFAPAQFRAMSDAEKLSSPSFERMVSGARLTPSNAVRIGRVQETPLDYEQSVILDVDQPQSEPLEERYEPDGAAVARLAEHGPAGTAELRDQGRAKFAPEESGPAVAEPEFVVATKDGLEPVDVGDLDGSYAGALERLRGRGDRAELQVVRAEELAPA